MNVSLISSPFIFSRHSESLMQPCVLFASPYLVYFFFIIFYYSNISPCVTTCHRLVCCLLGCMLSYVNLSTCFFFFSLLDLNYVLSVLSSHPFFVCLFIMMSIKKKMLRRDRWSLRLFCFQYTCMRNK